MVNLDSDLYREHPDWVYHFPSRPRTQSRNQLVLNLAKEEVKEHLFGLLDRLLSEDGISFIKWDMNRPFSEPGWMEGPEGRRQEIWVRHMWAVYEILIRLRKKYPGVAFESCSAGGGRVDLGILRVTDQAWTSDTTDPFDRLRIQEGFSIVYPARAMMCWVANSQQWVENRRASVNYRFHSAMMGSLGIGGNLLEWSEEEMQEARRLVEKYKEIRDIIQEGDQYRLLSPRKADTTAVQYVSGDRTRSVLFALRDRHRFLDRPPTIRLHGLREGSLYRLAGDEDSRSGASLMEVGIEVSLEGDLSSALIGISEVEQ